MSEKLRAASCPFCEIVAGREPATIVYRWDDATAIEPLNPVTPGHLLVIPHTHVADYIVRPDITATVMRRAAQFAARPSNLITSAGRAATQSVRHLHVHIVPRTEDDNLPLPWTPQQTAEQLQRLASIWRESPNTRREVRNRYPGLAWAIEHMTGEFDD